MQTELSRHIRLRRAREASGAAAPAITMWFFPWASYAAVTGMAAILIAMAFTPGELAQELRVSVRARRRTRGLAAAVAGQQAGR